METFSRGNQRLAFSLVELLVVLALLGILMGLLFPAIQAAREAARRTECGNKVRQLALAALNYESAHRSLPPPSVADAGFSTMGSAFVVLLPYLEQTQRFEAFRIHEPIDSPANVGLAREALRDFLCPSMPTNQNNQDGSMFFGEGSYLISFSTSYKGPANGAFADPPAVAGGRYRLGLEAFRDGASHTFLFGEIDNSVKWLAAGYPGQLNHVWAQGYWFNSRGHGGGTFNLKSAPHWTDFKQHRTFRSDHPGGVMFARVDGSTHFVADQVDPSLLHQSITRAGGEIPVD